MEGPVGNQGFVTDAAILAFKKVGLNAIYKNVPYNRALLGMENQEYDVLLAVSPGRENYIFPDNYFGRFKNTYFVRKNSDWNWNGVESLEGYVLGAINGYKIDDVFNKYVDKYSKDKSRVDFVYGQRALELNLNKLASGRIDIIIDDSLVVWHTANKIGLADEIRAAGVSGTPKNITVGFNLNNPKAKEYQKQFSKGLSIIKKSGEYKEILKRYDLENKIK